MKFLQKTSIDFINKKRLTGAISIAIILAGLVSLFIKGGPALSIDFTGGTIAQLQFDKPVSISDLREDLKSNGFEGTEIIEFGSAEEVLIKTQFKGSSSDLTKKLNRAFEDEFTVRRVESVGPKIGKELQSDALQAIGMALLLILIYIAFRFDRFYAIGSVAALVHDVLITLGVFSILNLEIDLSIVAVFLTIVGYSLNDTIVVFDRIRENMTKMDKKDTLKNVVNKSLNETLSRTVVTSLTTLMVVFILYSLGGEVIRYFSFALIIGVMVGTYSSLFVASPVMLDLETRSKKNK